jgi:hypothetical protein
VRVKRKNFLVFFTIGQVIKLDDHAQIVILGPPLH